MVIDKVVKRPIHFYLDQIEVPAGYIFCFPPQIVPGRMSLLVILLLVCINLFNGTPARGVETCLDQFMFICIFFIVSAIGEYALVLSLIALQR